MTHRVRSADGVQLEVAESGDATGPTVVLIHGYPDTKEMWAEVVRRLAGSFHLVTYDVRGAGGSDRPRQPAAYDLDRLGDDLSAVLQATARGRRVHLVGHDWGGVQGWEFATRERFRDWLSSFTSIAGPSLDQVALDGRRLLAERQLVAWLRRGWRSWYILALLTPGMPTVIWRWALAGGRWGRLLEAREGVPAAADYPRPTLARDAAAGANLYRRNIPRRLLAPRRDATAHVPVQLIVPSRDRYIHPSYYDRAGEHAPVLRRHVLAGSHWLPRTAPEEVARLIASFVWELEGRAKAL